MAFVPPTRQPFALAPLIGNFLYDFARGVPTPFSTIAARFAHAFYPPPYILGVDNIPPDSPFLLVFNHYESPRAAAWWSPLLAAPTIAARRTQPPRDVHFVMAREWWYEGGFGRALKQPLTHWAFMRGARIYGLVTMPPIVEALDTRGQGALGVRRALELTRSETPALVGIAPEGRTGPNGQLCEPPAGAGIFLLLLSHGKIPLLPLGIYEHGERQQLTLRFGGLFDLTDSRARDRAERDHAASTRVMQALAALLPETLRGSYSP